MRVRKIQALGRLLRYAIKVRGENHPHTINIRRFFEGYVRSNPAMCKRAMRDMVAHGQHVRDWGQP